MDEEVSDGFEASAADLVSTAYYTISVPTDDAGIRFDSSCGDREEQVTVAAWSATPTLHACGLRVNGEAVCWGSHEGD